MYNVENGEEADDNTGNLLSRSDLCTSVDILVSTCYLVCANRDNYL